MHPILIEIGPITIYTYGFMIALGFIVGISLASRQANKEGIDPVIISDLGFWCLISAIVGSRLLFGAIYWREFIDEPLRIAKIWEGGLVFYGGFIAATLTMVYFIRKKRLKLLQTLDILAPSVAVGQGIGRLGCFAAGCCYGKETNLTWAVTFTDIKCLAPIGKPLHPTQLYASIDLFLIFGLLILIRWRFKKFDGQIAACYLILISIHRFFIEFFRGDDRGFIGIFSTSFSTSQFISIILFTLGIVWFSYATFKISSRTNVHQAEI
jgi:phosphatidylglycerol:prolipoprotein diacylglycerol transferase